MAGKCESDRATGSLAAEGSILVLASASTGPLGGETLILSRPSVDF